MFRSVQAHPHLAPSSSAAHYSVSATPSPATTKYTDLVLTMLQDVMLNSRLLVPVKLTAYGEIALQTLIFMLVCLPASSLVLQFILEHLNDSFSTLASLTDHRIVGLQTFDLTSLYSVPTTISNTFTDAGTYVFTHLQTGHQYVGSATNFTTRLVSHLAQFIGSMAASDFHTFVMSNGGLESINWSPPLRGGRPEASPVYTTFNYTEAFNSLYRGAHSFYIRI
jgi:hypothetical protein